MRWERWEDVRWEGVRWEGVRWEGVGVRVRCGGEGCCKREEVVE